MTHVLTVATSSRILQCGGWICVRESVHELDGEPKGQDVAEISDKVELKLLAMLKGRFTNVAGGERGQHLGCCQ